jgi:hypothetical protein
MATCSAGAIDKEELTMQPVIRLRAPLPRGAGELERGRQSPALSSFTLTI